MTELGPFVLVPGAGGAAWYWHRVVAELERRGHRAVAVELPGDDEDCELEDYVDAVVSASGSDRDIVMVGQSLGGFTATLAAGRLPVSTLIFVNAMIPAPGETPGGWWADTGQAAAKAAMDRRDGRSPDAEFDPMTYFLHDVPQDVVRAGEDHVKEQAGRVFGSAAMFDAWPRIAIHVLVGRDDRFFPAEFQRRVAKDRLGLDVVEVPGGHLVALSRPVDLTDAILACCS